MSTTPIPAPAKPFSIRARLRSFQFAWRGVLLIVQTQHNAWIHAAASAGVVAAGILVGLGRTDWCLIVLAMMAVWTAEALNTALEFLCDVATAGQHPLIAKAKDVAAGGVLISAAGAVVIAILVFGPHFYR